MLTTIATVFAGLISAGLIAIGSIFFTAPQAAAGFGIPDSPIGDPTFRSWLTAKGLRELAPGVFGFVLIAVASPAVLGWYLLVFAAIPAGDSIVVLRSGGPKATAYGVHAATSAVMVATSICLLVR